MTVDAWAGLSAALLPKVLQDFLRLIGLQATMLLLQHFGGQRLYIPARPPADDNLAKLIGLDKLTALSRVYGLEDHFDIPKAVDALRHLRDEKIRADYATKSASALACEHHLTERQIRKILGKQPIDLGGLFSES